MAKRALLGALLWIAARAAAQLPGLTVNGDPASAEGATWTYQDTINDTIYDLSGILLKPGGAYVYPGIIISHGLNCNAFDYSLAFAQAVRPWGLVCIAVNYTHAWHVPVGSPGDTSQPGASLANIQRAFAGWRILGSLDYVDTNRIAVHGHSNGGYVTAAFCGAHPEKVRVASHTASGVCDTSRNAAKTWQASRIAGPYQMHHGDLDNVVPLSYDRRLDSVLQSNGIDRQLYVYHGGFHNSVALDTTVLRRVRQWYIAYGVLDTVSSVGVTESGSATRTLTVLCAPNPARQGVSFTMSYPARGPVSFLVYDVLGRRQAEWRDAECRHQVIWRGAPGVYVGRLTSVDGQALVRFVILP